ncbi:hypothetical protein ACE01N_07095 [Saccharicrinis sp. FJH2]|uniref:hypothetical protein n=1 Tax=Saccharicrinis sp. FJH65 TaxID=3344659 RepID=UPI0035F32057
MVNTIKYIIELLLVIIVFMSCTENAALKKDVYNVNIENSEWINFSELERDFSMIDNNAISYSFGLSDRYHEYDKSWTSVVGINTHMSYREEYYESYTSTYGLNYSLNLSASFEPNGDCLDCRLGEVRFKYDLDKNILCNVDYDNEYKSLQSTSDGYIIQNDSIYSIAEFIDSVMVNQVTYYNVLHFTLHDFAEEWKDFTINEIYLAKQTGLIQYTYTNGISVCRIN